MKTYGTLEAYFNFCQGNGLGLSAELVPGQVLEAVDFTPPPVVPKLPSVPMFIARKAVVSEGQSFLDVLLRECGTLEKALEVAQLNGFGLTTALAIGQSISLHGITPNAVANYFNTRGIRINTHTPGQTAQGGLPDGVLLADGDGKFIIDFDNAYIAVQ
ncbi:hypothetical protein [Rufibacter quisquiliarum]|uniref:Uncharacterized protein n=1 Tax=Rufibacter quisquiliarum TaxID=1549639 RepID=A0A839GM52_9BACT|nr:hypothetical protein [Rufibacter quisquiliarum]MBA9078933.1 hypothetical protein [Rufibacter quisquiliarum]